MKFALFALLIVAWAQCSDTSLSFYFEAAKTLDRLDAKHGSIKGILATLPEKDRKRTAALVIETLKCKRLLSSDVSWYRRHKWSDKSALNDIINASKLLTQERKLSSRNLALVLVHDVLLARGIQAGDGPLKQAVLRHKTRLHSELQRVKIKRGARSNEELADMGDARAGRLPLASYRQWAGSHWTSLAQIPRYIRINTSMWSTKEAIQAYISKGFEPSKPIDSVWVSVECPMFLSLIDIDWPRTKFAVDDHIPDLLLFSPRMQFQDDAFYKAGKIILQDKASCFPAVVLAPPATDNSVVIDATAAPGNKTSHLSALMQNKGKVCIALRTLGRNDLLHYSYLLSREIKSGSPPWKWCFRRPNAQMLSRWISIFSL